MPGPCSPLRSGAEHGGAERGDFSWLGPRQDNSRSRGGRELPGRFPEEMRPCSGPHGRCCCFPFSSRLIYGEHEARWGLDPGLGSFFFPCTEGTRPGAGGHQPLPQFSEEEDA